MNLPTDKDGEQRFLEAFRHSAPYIHAHRGHTFVLLFAGEALQGAVFEGLMHDIALLHSLGIRLVLVPGIRPQIDALLAARGIAPRFEQGLRVTDEAALDAALQAAGTVCARVTATLSRGWSHLPGSRQRIRVLSGNLVVARPLGVREGVDFQHTGEVRRIDTEALREALDGDRIVLLPPLGYSPTGEIFNLHAEELAREAAVALQADKLVFLVAGPGLRDGRRRRISQLTAAEVLALLSGRRRLDPHLERHLRSALLAVRQGIERCHIIGLDRDGALLLEFFTREGTGTLVTAEPWETIRRAVIDDVGGILELIRPLEESGVLVRRSREKLETEIDRFHVLERDGMILGCAALYPEGEVGELACLAVHPDYRNGGRGQRLLEHIEAVARRQGIRRLFVLTTHTADWFRERGFHKGSLDHLPVRRRRLYNYRRNSRVYVKPLDAA
ncbi:MAG: amino-acid N-acetyltransferase [Gammaproteobacteria bacterium]|nr:MAG: amino-acid N-acetyltransferase [Gammaproteobacteria bacterium]